jgi:hypothetical protein
MNRLPTVVFIVVSVVAVIVAVVWMTQYQGPPRRSRLMSQPSTGAGGGMSSAAAPGGGPMTGGPMPTTVSGPGMPGGGGMGGGGMMGMGGGGMGFASGGSTLRPRPFHVGTIQPADMVTVSAPFAGNVVEVFVEDGDAVRRGQPLLRFVSSEASQQQVVISAPQRGMVSAPRQTGDSSDPALDTFIRFPHVGQHVNAGAPLVDVLDDQTSVILLNVPEREIDLVEPAQEVMIRSRVLQEGTTLKGKVVRVSRVGRSRAGNNANTVVFPVTVRVLEPLGKLRLGMSVEVEWKQVEKTQQEGDTSSSIGMTSGPGMPGLPMPTSPPGGPGVGGGG